MFVKYGYSGYLVTKLLNIWDKLFLRRPFHDWELRAIIFSMRERLGVVVILYCIACLSTLYCVMYCQYSAVFVRKKNNPSITQIRGLKHYLLLILIYYVGNCIITDETRFGSNLCTSTYIVLSPFVMSFYFCIRQTIILFHN